MPEKILIVDDNVDLRKTVRVLLGGTHEVLEAADGREALDLIRAHRPRLVLLDITMPGMSGLDTLRTAKDLEPGVVVLMLTSEPEMEVALRALELGAAEYMTKPFDAGRLRDAVERLLRKEPPGGTRDSGRPWRTASKA